MRAGAIALVFMYHYMIFVSGKPTFGWASEIGWTGVDLFFVLSGYLIANQLFAGLVRGRALSLPRFYLRRALRTLPVFWLVLAAYFAFPAALGGRTPPPPWRFLTFTQNFDLPTGTAFSHAWSLCVEEQFYLVLPAVLAFGCWLALRMRARRVTRAHGWMLIAGLVALGVGARIELWGRYGQAGNERGYMAWIYYATLCRFDELLPGVAVAMLKNFHRPTWNRLMAHGGRLFALGALAAIALWIVDDTAYYVDGVGYGFFATAFGYSLLAWAFALLVAAALSPARTPLAWRVPGARRLALWSYSTYLVHKPLATVLAGRLEPLELPAGVDVVVITLACIAAGALLYRLVETPFMAWRDRHCPSNFRDGDDRASAVALTPGACGSP